MCGVVMRRRFAALSEDLEQRLVLSVSPLSPRGLRAVETQLTQEPQPEISEDATPTRNTELRDVRVVESTSTQSPVIEVVEARPPAVITSVEPDVVVVDDAPVAVAETRPVTEVVDTRPVDEITDAEIAEVDEIVTRTQETLDSIKDVAKQLIVELDQRTDTARVETQTEVVFEAWPEDVTPDREPTVARIADVVSDADLTAANDSSSDVRSMVQGPTAPVTNIASEDVTLGDRLLESLLPEDPTKTDTPQLHNSESSEPTDAESIILLSNLDTPATSDSKPTELPEHTLDPMGMLLAQSPNSQGTPQNHDHHHHGADVADNDAIASLVRSMTAAIGNGGIDVDVAAASGIPLAALAGLLTIAKVGRKGVAEVDRVAKDASLDAMSLWDLRTGRDRRHGTHSKTESQAQSRRQKFPAKQLLPLDQPDVSDAFAMSVMGAVSPDDFSMVPMMPVGQESAGDDIDSNTGELVATTIAAGTVAGGVVAQRKLSKGKNAADAQPSLAFTGTTLVR